MRAVRDFPAVVLHRDPIDFRKGIFSLAAYVQANMHSNLTDGTLYVFSNRSRDAVKCLYWDRSGFALWTKILERQRFAWPQRTDVPFLVLNPEQLEWLLQGFDILALKPLEEVELTRTF